VRDNPDIVVIGATNRLDLIDPAVMRPGRFGVRVPVPRPDAEGRAEILRILLQPVMAADEPVEDVTRRLAEVTDGLSGADLAGVVDRARRGAMANAGADLNVREKDVMAVLGQ
jgi:ATP-dependent 26S proteasome regulatory subunit